MKKPRTEYGRAQGAKMLHGLRVAAQRLQREEFNKIVAPGPVQLKFGFMRD
jgi:hypothetical protein